MARNLREEIEAVMAETGCRAREIALAAGVTDASISNIRHGRQRGAYEDTAERIRRAIAFIRVSRGMRGERDGR